MTLNSTHTHTHTHTVYKCENLLKEQINNSRDKRAVFWGASEYLKDFIKKYNISNDNILAVIDSNVDRIGTFYGKYQVMSPSCIESLGVEVVIFTIKNNANVAYLDIKAYLSKFSNILLLDNVFKYVQMDLKCKESVEPQKTLDSISVHIVEHCNLNCRGCDNFSPIAEKKFECIENFEKDIKRIAELSNGELGQLKLLGGEPLLHPQIIRFLKVSRKYLPNTDIKIVTNGILLTSQSEEFWKACKINNIIIVVTKYPIKLDFEKMENLAASYGVQYKYYGNSAVIKYSHKIPLDLKGEQDIYRNFKHCHHANKCVFLRDGKLYPCSIPPNIHHFNSYFNQSIPICEEDGIDIYNTESMDKVLKFLAKPIPFCRYCFVCYRLYKQKWGISAKQIEEWSI